MSTYLDAQDRVQVALTLRLVKLRMEDSIIQTKTVLLFTVFKLLLAADSDHAQAITNAI